MFLSKMRLCGLLLCVACGLPSSVYSQTTASKVNTIISINLRNGAISGGRVNNPDSVTAFSGSAISFADDQSSFGGANGLGSVNALASPGVLRARISGNAEAGGYRNSAITTVAAEAEFYDTVFISRDRPGAPEIPLGTVIDLQGSFQLSGFFDADARGTFSNTVNAPATDYADAHAYVELMIRGLGIVELAVGPYGNGRFGSYEYGYISRFPQTVRGIGDIVDTKLPPPPTVAWEAKFIWGAANRVGVHMDLTGVAQAVDLNLGAGVAPFANFQGAFERSLTWGGISSVTRADTGEVLTDWTVTSASGFDYSKPFADVPEPSSLLLVVTAALALARVRPKRS